MLIYYVIGGILLFALCLSIIKFVLKVSIKVILVFAVVAIPLLLLLNSEVFKEYAGEEGVDAVYSNPIFQVFMEEAKKVQDLKPDVLEDLWSKYKDEVPEDINELVEKVGLEEIIEKGD